MADFRRWQFCDGFQVRKNGNPFLDRLRIVQTPWFGLYLHRIHTPDQDRDPHDHPWNFWSLILSGGYTEHVWHPGKPWPSSGPHQVRVHQRWSAHKMPITHAHRVTDIRGNLWTLVVTGPKKRSWGFWTSPTGFMPWREYLGFTGQPGFNHGRGTDEELHIWGGRA